VFRDDPAFRVVALWRAKRLGVRRLDAAFVPRRLGFFERRTRECQTGAMCNFALCGDPKAASSRRTPRCLRHSLEKTARHGAGRQDQVQKQTIRR